MHSYNQVRLLDLDRSSSLCSVEGKRETTVDFHRSRIRIHSDVNLRESHHSAQVGERGSNLSTLLLISSLQIQSISISFVLGLSGGDHSLQRMVSSRVASKLSIDTIYDSSARKYYEYIIKSVRVGREREFSSNSSYLDLFFSSFSRRMTVNID